MKGLVVKCSRNSFTVQIEQENSKNTPVSPPQMLECNIKGKILKNAQDLYNPLAPGDIVSVLPDTAHPGKGQITGVEERANYFSRFNQKGKAPQLLAANVDLALCLTTPAYPPFRPRFLDRVILQADAAGIEPLIVCNKIDLGIAEGQVEKRLEDFSRIGYRVLRVSAKTGENIDQLKGAIAGKCSVVIGQSGVGKSSLINALFPGFNIKTGDMNVKYERGNHTTVMPALHEMPEEDSVTRIIDTPGIRRFVPDGISPDEVIVYFREFAPLSGKCSYGLSCSHRVEPGCKIMEAVADGHINEDRYVSFLRIIDEINGAREADYGD